jgi:hypothetical protein
MSSPSFVEWHKRCRHRRGALRSLRCRVSDKKKPLLPPGGRPSDPLSTPATGANTSSLDFVLDALDELIRGEVDRETIRRLLSSRMHLLLSGGLGAFARADPALVQQLLPELKDHVRALERLAEPAGGDVTPAEKLTKKPTDILEREHTILSLMQSDQAVATADIAKSLEGTAGAIKGSGLTNYLAAMVARGLLKTARKKGYYFKTPSGIDYHVDVRSELTERRRRDAG